MRRVRVNTFHILSMAAVGIPVRPDAADTYRYRAYRSPDPIVLDGKPDEAVWSRVPETARLKLATVHGDNAIPTRADSSAAIYAKAVWDATALYVFFKVGERHVWYRRSGRDSLGFWMENAVEIYLDDIGDNQRILEINFAPDGSITDIYNATKYSGTGSNTVLGYDVAGIAVGVSVEGTLCATFSASAPCNQDTDAGFGVEVKLPFASLKAIGPPRIDILGSGMRAPPRHLDSCRLNLFYTSCPPKATAPDNLDRINYAWEPSAGNDFHETSKYGTLILVDSALSGGVPVRKGGGAARGSGLREDRNALGRKMAERVFPPRRIRYPAERDRSGAGTIPGGTTPE